MPDDNTAPTDLHRVAAGLFKNARSRGSLPGVAIRRQAVAGGVRAVDADRGMVSDGHDVREWSHQLRLATVVPDRQDDACGRHVDPNCPDRIGPDDVLAVLEPTTRL